MKVTGAQIAKIRKNSLAAQAQLRPGDVLLAIDGKKPQDYIDYRFLTASEVVTLTLARQNAGEFEVEIEKEYDDDLGITFSSDVFDGVRTCRCRCEFCFVAQLPAGLRQSLYLRDDDYRLSFLHGNFITLTNLTEADYRRILRLHLSPLYISVHATEPKLRAGLMGCTPAGDIMTHLRRLIAGGIELHCQIVVCSGRNDGEHLVRTVNDLTSLYPGVQSIGIVPAGIIKKSRRSGVVGLESKQQSTFDDNLALTGATPAQEIIAQVARWQEENLARFGTRLVWASDEMYLLARQELPDLESYEEFPQRANGIGEARLFLEEIASPEMERLLSKVKQTVGQTLRVILGTGISASGLVSQLAERFNLAGIDTRVILAPNRLFGPTITTAGLVCGADWLAALQPALANEPADLVILPRQAINHDGYFLDDMHRRGFEKRLGVKVAFAAGPLAAAQSVIKMVKR
jgi:putative radical SAM enzyme (TIGR03279 family)